MANLDILNVPLAGANLLEASAGTGKTYTIECLFLRLVMEEAIPAGEILVVTYTVAATEELRDRIRRRLYNAAEAFRSGESSDAFLRALLAKHPGQERRSLFRQRLESALRDFDEAAVFTIHGFCHRVLRENAFESNVLFDAELITDERPVREETAADFWRRHFYRTIPEFAAYALSRRHNLAYFRKLIDSLASHHDIEVIPGYLPSPLGVLKEQTASYNAAFRAVADDWPSVRGAIHEMLSSPSLNARIYGKNTAGLMAEMDGLVASGGPFYPLFDGFVKFTAPRIALAARKNCLPPEHDFFHRCEALYEKALKLQEEMEASLLYLKWELARTLKKELASRKARDNVLFYDDLLVKTRDALMGRGGEALQKVIAGKYRAALIDEFQDTDPVQFAIFHQVFGKAGAPFFLIGDPKQSIYGFRGADIFAYMNAASGLAKRHTIGENWRSDPRLVNAVNLLFSRRGEGRAFIFKEIPFPAVQAAQREQDLFTLDGVREAPMQLWFVPSEKYGEKGKPIPLGRARRIIVDALSAEIARLLHAARQGRALIGEKRLGEADIAVLVRTNREALLVQRGLRKLSIPSVLYNAGNIFDTAEAEEMERILAAVAAPEEERLVRAALLTDIIGAGLVDAERLLYDEAEWERRTGRFHLWRGLWLESGFIAMFAAFMAGEGVRERLLRLPDGERRLTNLLHLAELLQRTSLKDRSGPPALLRWLSEQRDPSALRLDEHQLRLESDERAVKIVTIHKSKGLEYPVVFCPFAWSGAALEEDYFYFHDEDRGGRLTCLLGSADADIYRAKALREILAENMRLLYVALTRARNRCYMVWGRFSRTAMSAPAYLFHGMDGEDDAGGENAALREEKFKELNDADMFRRLEQIATAARGDIFLREIPTPQAERLAPQREGEAALTYRSFSGRIDRSAGVFSFTSLVSERRRDAEAPDHDETIAASAPERGLPEFDFPEPDGGAEKFDIFSFPRGAEAGTLLHAILERYDFTEKDGDRLRSLVAERLAAQGFAGPWEGVVLDLLMKVAGTALPSFDAAETDVAPFRLSMITPEQRVNEMEFYFPLNAVAPDDLAGLFARFPAVSRETGGAAFLRALPQQIGRLHFSPAHGHMRGFVDMVFCRQGRYYLVDWKSNFLGGRPADYAFPRLVRAMADNYYELQYHIYALALHQYLKLRLGGYSYGEHFGGVYYLFLRGLEGDGKGRGAGVDFPPRSFPPNGVFFARPEEALILEMAEKLIAR